MANLGPPLIENMYYCYKFGTVGRLKAEFEKSPMKD